MLATLPVAPAIRFHLSLNVSDLGRSVGFYQTLFGRPPAKRRDDYAKFELDDPPLVLSLEPHAGGHSGALNHAGFRMPDSASLVAMQQRLEQAGVRSRREEGVECCYARQTKFWVTDPDQTLWEIYTLDEDIDHRGRGQSPSEMLPHAPPPSAPAAAASPAAWEHRMTDPVPSAIPRPDASVDEVRLLGTLNLALPEEARQRLAAEVNRVLRPGGRVFIHVLTADRPPKAEPALPGPAAAVQHVPVESEPLRLLESAGFEGVRLLQLDAKPCFVRDGVEMRETRAEAWKPARNGSGVRPVVLYKGPFREVADDGGVVYPRGERVTVDLAAVERLRRGGWAEHFLILAL
jgi:catechol 2,3-dioxygenase-like lactoylglutathione lyase family enzyme